ncbi:MAG: COX15/CtaA family protein [Candidatus Sumerlaeaceae bacterium]|nr:COX15/CtaA family protein [Candidatus Sumerlaeaceae bacterium]
MSQIEPVNGGDRPSYALSAFAKLTAISTFILICAGALITGNKAALSDPTWPKFAGQNYPTADTFVGGMRYEDSHRIIAGTVGILIAVLAFWVQFKVRKRAPKVLAWGAVACVVAQAVIGGFIILYLRPMVVSILHACVGQALFMMLVALAVILSPKRVGSVESSGTPRPGASFFRIQCVVACCVVYCLLILGATVRHAADVFMPQLVLHISLALFTVVMLIWLSLQVFTRYRDVADLRRVIWTLFTLIAVQYGLGVVAIFANRARLQPEAPDQAHVLLSTAHVGVGALILISFLIMALRAFQHLPVSQAAEKHQTLTEKLA